MASPFNSKNNRLRFQSSSTPGSTKTSSAFSYGSKTRNRYESGAGKALRSNDADEILNQEGIHSSSSTTSGINHNAFSSSSPFNGRKTIAMYETVPLEKRVNCGSPSSFDAFIFEAKNSEDHNNSSSNNNSNDNCSVSRTRAIKSGRRLGKVPAQTTLFPNYSSQPSDNRFNSWKNQCSDFDQFLFEQLRSSSWQDTREDMCHQFRDWDPFQAQTAGDDSDGDNDNNNDGDTSSRPGIGDSTFKLGAKEAEVPEANLPDVMAGSGNGGGGEFNRSESFTDSIVGHEHWEPKAREMGDFHGNDHEAFVFGASKPKRSVAARSVQEFQSPNCYGEFEAARGSSHCLKSNCGRRSDNLFADKRPIIASRFVSSGGRNAGESVDGGPIPPIFIVNVGEKFDLESKGKDSGKQDPVIEPFGSSASTCAVSPLFCRVSEKDTLKGAGFDGAHGRGGTGGISSPLESSTLKDPLSKRDESWISVDNSSSTSNHMFEFGATKGHNASRKREMKYTSSSSGVLMGHLAHHTGGKLPMKFPTCTKTATENAPFASHDIPDLEQPSMAWNNLFQSGHRNQMNLHHSIGGEDNVEEPRATDANLHTVIDQQTNAENFYLGKLPIGGQHQCRWSSTDEGECGIPPRSNKWQWSFCEEHTSTPSSENDWLNSIPEKLRTDEFESGNNTTTAKVGGSNQRRRFASGASSRLSSSASGFARKNHRPNAKFKNSDKKSGSPFAMRPFGLETETMLRHVPGQQGDLYDQTVKKEKITVEAPNKLLDPLSVTGSPSLLSNQKAESGLPANPKAVESVACEQVCEKWRLRGNQAYANGDFPKAEEYYSCGASCIPPSEKSKSCIRAAMLCYSNRAATRMAVGRMREALTDCMHAMDLDSKFVRAQIRAASCHLALGECEAALKLFKDCTGYGDESETLGVKVAVEALEGIRKAQQVEVSTDQAVQLLNAGNSEDASNALHLVNEALSISPHSEKLLELKARALLSLCNHEEVIRVCEESMASVELNHRCGNCSSENPMGNKDTPPSQCYCPVKLRLLQMTGKAHFYLGRLEQALDSLLKYEEANSAVVRSSGENMESLGPLIATVNDLLHHKAAGNEAFQAGKYAEAVEHYTAALACNNESRPFTAVCFCNRAAASHALGHIVDAIADCNRAITLDSEYPKAVSRRALLHEMIRNYGQAISDLHRLITLQERHEQQGKGNKTGRLGSSSYNTQDLREAHERLTKAEENMKKGNPLDHYLILGVEPSCTAAEIKKAYRKAALKHHPDKAGQFLVRSDNGDDALLKEFGDEVRRDAEKLFKMIGEAYGILSEPGKRLRYDTEEELRKLRTEQSTSGAEPLSEPHRYQYGKDSRHHREGWDSWNDHENQYQHWQSGPDASQSDTYSCQGSNNSRFSDGFRWNDYDWDDI